jgi:integrase
MTTLSPSPRSRSFVLGSLRWAAVSGRPVCLGSDWAGTGRVWTRPDGADLRPSWLGDRFAALITASGLPPIRFHDLRHVAATMMLAAKVDLKVIQETLGHERLQTTSDLYTSVLPELARDAAEATVALIPRAPRQTLGHPSGTQREPTAIASGGGMSEHKQNRS